MAGCSGTPLPRKLGIKPGGRLLLTDAPETFIAVELAELPDGVTVHDRHDGVTYDVVLLFARAEGALHAGFEHAAERITMAGRLWVAWPRKAGGFVSDVDESAIREIALAAGLVDNKVAAISTAWSGLQIVHRLRDRH